jgi:GxxExxY protein
MDADGRRLAINAVTEQIIGAAYQVSNSFGAGFLEKVYENSLAYELRKRGHHVQQQYPINVGYDGVIVGDYIADLIVEELVLVEVKSVKCFDDIHLAQCLNYLKATGLNVCLLINFGTPKIEVKPVLSG